MFLNIGDEMYHLLTDECAQAHQPGDTILFDKLSISYKNASTLNQEKELAKKIYIKEFKFDLLCSLPKCRPCVRS